MRFGFVVAGLLGVGAVAPAAAWTERVAVPDSVPRAAARMADQGAIPETTAIEHMQLALARPAALQAALDATVAGQADPASPLYHRWLSPARVGARFGPPTSAVRAAVAWLQSQGFAVERIAPSRMSIAFSGTAGQVNAAFQTSMHRYTGADDTPHIGNASAVTLPAGLAASVAGVTLSDFFPRPAVHPRGPARRAGASGLASLTGEDTQGSVLGTFYAVTPQDLAVIYDIKPLWTAAAPVAGQGQTVIVAEQTDIQPADWQAFRAAFGLSSYGGTLQTVHPGGCGDPGFTGDEGEAALDAEWAGAVAPAASIVVASCAGTATMPGVYLAVQNLVEYGPSGAAISVSYGACEAANGITFDQQWANTLQQAAAEGIAVFVAAGDTALAGCDDAASEFATDGTAVNGLASPAYAVAVSGTDFPDSLDGTTARYWSDTTQADGQSALSYLPEIPWDTSCATSVIWRAFQARDAVSFCNSAPAYYFGTWNIVGGGGGRSRFFGKPGWQGGTPGMPNDGHRDLPDVSMFASNGVWGHFYLFCMSDAAQGGAPCDYSDGGDFLGSAAGGTSFGAPIYAGIDALIAQQKGPTGSPAARFYQLAKRQMTGTTARPCNSASGPVSGCAFRTISRGDTAVPCLAGTTGCALTRESVYGIGVLSMPISGSGWNYATGLGSVDVFDLVNAY